MEEPQQYSGGGFGGGFGSGFRGERSGGRNTRVIMAFSFWRWARCMHAARAKAAVNLAAFVHADHSVMRRALGAWRGRRKRRFAAAAAAAGWGGSTEAATGSGEDYTDEDEDEDEDDDDETEDEREATATATSNGTTTADDDDARAPRSGGDRYTGSPRSSAARASAAAAASAMMLLSPKAVAAAAAADARAARTFIPSTPTLDPAFSPVCSVSTFSRDQCLTVYRARMRRVGEASSN